MAQLKAPLYYYDNNGYKIGPINKKELFALAEQGAINPDTRITDDNIEVKAKNLTKLKFYAPEYHRAEELFNPENINFNIPPQINTQQIVPPKNQTENNISTPANQADFSKLTRHPLTITTVILIAITAIASTITAIASIIICYILVSAVIALGLFSKELEEQMQNRPERPKFERPEINRDLPQAKIPQHIHERWEELDDKIDEKLQQPMRQFVEMMRPPGVPEEQMPPLQRVRLPPLPNQRHQPIPLEPK